MAYASAADEGKTIMLHQLYVRPDCQGCGIGGMLMEEIEDSFHDADKMRLEVEEANDQAVRFYRAQGFVQVGRTANCGKDQSGIPAVIYEKPLVWTD